MIQLLDHVQHNADVTKLISSNIWRLMVLMSKVVFATEKQCLLRGLERDFVSWARGISTFLWL